MPTPIVRRGSSGAVQVWSPTTLAAAGLPESELESILSRPGGFDLLGLRQRGLRYRKVRTWTQVMVRTPDGRTIRPDLIALTDTGHVIVVEVKRFGNPELRGRDVIAQIVDYAAAFSTMSQEQLARVFRRSEAFSDFEAMVKAEFPGEPDPRGLASEFVRRLSDGELTLVIACDEAPPGLADWIRAIGNQSAMSFELKVIEVTPYVSDEAPGELLFASAPAIETEIIARTAITIRNEVGTDRIVVNAQVAEAEDVQDAAAAVASGVSRQRRSGVYGAFLADVEQRALDLLAQEGAAVRWSQEVKRVHGEIAYEELVGRLGDDPHRLVLRIYPHDEGGAVFSVFIAFQSSRIDQSDRLGRFEEQLGRAFAAAGIPSPELQPNDRGWRQFRSASRVLDVESEGFADKLAHELLGGIRALQVLCDGSDARG